MSPAEAKKRIAELREQIARHDELYYRRAQPEIGDFEYDILKHELAELEKQSPSLAVGTSPMERVGDDRLEGFATYRHRQPMQSLDNTYSEEEYRAFHQRLAKLFGREDLAYVVEPKIDGLAVSLTYENGRFVRAVTRGNGEEGDDVTANVRTIHTLPPELKATKLQPAPGAIEIRGEIYLTTAEFQRINQEREEAGEALYANPRNLAAGTIKQLDPRLVAQRKLEIVLYGIGYCEPAVADSQSEFLALVKQWGLPTVEKFWPVRGIDEAWKAVRELDKLRHAFAYGTDGAVTKLDSFALRRDAGSTSKAPHWAIAYKFEPERAETRINAITVQVGRTGVLTPVAELEPVLLAGSTVARATLHNRDEIARKDIRVGDYVRVEKAGEVIPAVIEVNLQRRVSECRPYQFPDKCPECSTAVIQIEGEVAIRCPNLYCPAQLTRRLDFFASKSALNLEGLGGIIAEKLVERGLVAEPLDLFTLSTDKLADLNLGSDVEPRIFGEKNARKILEAIERAKQLPLARWLLAFAIPEVGEETAHDIASLHSSLKEVASSSILRDYVELDQLNSEMLRNSPTTKENKAKSIEERNRMRPDYEKYKSLADALGNRLIASGLAKPAASKNPPPRNAVATVGPVASRSVLSWFSSERGVRVLERMDELGIAPTSSKHANTASPFFGKSVVFTGTFSTLSRNEAQDKIRALGGNVAGSVSRKTDLVVAGPGAGTKLNDARKYGISIIDEAEFLRLLTVR
ncbi:MAG: NAD-dependent DNA ligase LigA [Opitutaceae bacterium]|nr:NAD-dependent DNA ligase LigA [Opitutaceae bacterium]